MQCYCNSMLYKDTLYNLCVSISTVHNNCCITTRLFQHDWDDGYIDCWRRIMLSSFPGLFGNHRRQGIDKGGMLSYGRQQG